MPSRWRKRICCAAFLHVSWIHDYSISFNRDDAPHFYSMAKIRFDAYRRWIHLCIIVYNKQIKHLCKCSPNERSYQLRTEVPCDLTYLKRQYFTEKWYFTISDCICERSLYLQAPSVVIKWLIFLQSLLQFRYLVVPQCSSFRSVFTLFNKQNSPDLRLDQ